MPWRRSSSVEQKSEIWAVRPSAPSFTSSSERDKSEGKWSVALHCFGSASSHLASVSNTLLTSKTCCSVSHHLRAFLQIAKAFSSLRFKQCTQQVFVFFEDCTLCGFSLEGGCRGEKATLSRVNWAICWSLARPWKSESHINSHNSPTQSKWVKHTLRPSIYLPCSQESHYCCTLHVSFKTTPVKLASLPGFKAWLNTTQALMLCSNMIYYLFNTNVYFFPLREQIVVTVNNVGNCCHYSLIRNTIMSLLTNSVQKKDIYH